jgi:hypothetical protein
MAQLETRNIDTAHETRKFQANGHIDVVTLGTFTLGRGTFQPGWQGPGMSSRSQGPGRARYGTRGSASPGG